jgi:glutamate/tyrosine decarboxylase-like PLP-dependent enzyme
MPGARHHLTFIYIGTYTGHFEPVEEMAELLDEYEQKTGHFVPIHGMGHNPVTVPKLTMHYHS